MLEDNQSIMLTDSEFFAIMELTREEKQELIKMWREYRGKKQRSDS